MLQTQLDTEVLFEPYTEKSFRSRLWIKEKHSLLLPPSSQSCLLILQVNTEPAKSKNFSLVVNLPASDGQEGGGRGSEHPVTRSSEVSRDVVEGFGGGEVLLKGGGEASVLSESSEESLGRQGEAELGEVDVEVDEVVDEVKENENGEKQSRSIVSVRLGEEGSRFSFAKVGTYKLSFY